MDPVVDLRDAPATNEMDGLPTGTLTFLFTDIEGSTRLLDELGPGYLDVMNDHGRIIRAAIEEHGGREVNTEGDSFFAVFPSAADAVLAAAAMQRGLATHRWPSRPLRVRMGLHTGEAVVGGRDYIGLDVNRAARIAAAARGGQVLISASTKALADGHPSTGVAGISLRDLGPHRLKDLASPERLHQLVIAGLPDDFPPPRSLETVPSNLPDQLTTFFGREKELADTQELLATARLVTLTGPGGSGKTRLGLQVGKRLVGSFLDGVFFVPLAALREPELVMSAIAHALGLQVSTPDVRDLVLDRVVDKEILLILDNFEQLLPAGPEVVELLAAAPRLRVLVTSRSPLGVYGEREYPVPPLAVPSPSRMPSVEELSRSEAVALFIDRARSARPGFELTPANARAVAEICARLDGLPLAIELAAARVKLLTPAAILARLDARLDLLATGGRDVPERQRTLRGTIAWSYELLTAEERRLFAQLGVFLGGAGLPQIAQVLELDELALLDRLASLADQSLVRRVEDDDLRVDMLETIREFATERLEQDVDASVLRERHALVFAALAEEAEPMFLGPDGRAWLDRLDREHDNVRAAFRWSLDEGKPAVALRLAGALWRFWQMRGHLAEGRERTEELLASAPMTDMALHARALTAAGGLAYWQADFSAARAHYEESLKLWRRTDDESGVAEGLYNLSFTYFMSREDPVRARELAEESLTIYRRLGDEVGIANTLWALGSIEQSFAEPRFDEARQHYAEASDLYAKLGNCRQLAWTHFMAAGVEARSGNLRPARTRVTEALHLFVLLDDLSGYALALNGFASIAWAQGNREEAARAAAAAGRLERTTGVNLSASTAGHWTEGFDRSAIDGDAGLAGAWAAGEAIEPTAVVAEILAAAGSSGIELARDRRTEADPAG